ncbi:FAD-dependent oxidoreductase [Suttonella ornithocola]|uniref:Mercuric reductase n=2 Tax=Suttonella ornithocola TaxID=279832 RepID=A0A380N071_9GAMM|nr:FAD-dependent oxidoreductase [Suttonella ornithocola]SUO97666.1 Mercuric reductase [Suttonella ornithocola]
MRQVENLIIGFGKAGKTLAGDLAKAGQSVILVEASSKMYGGTCINIGCIPSKKLAFLAHEKAAETGLAFEQAVVQKDKLISALNKANYEKVAKVAEVITGKATFKDAHTVEISLADGGEETIQAERIFINTGASNWQPPIEGVENNPYILDSTALMELEKTPEHLVIVGGGYIGLEFAFTLSSFGSKVTILETLDTFLPREDREIAAELEKIMNKRNIHVRLNQKVKRIEASDTQAIVHTADDTLTADAVLIATGRRANVEGLGLEKAGVELAERGHIAVNDKLQTSQPHIWAMGDVAGSPQFTYISLDDYRIVKDQLLGEGKRTTKGRTFPYAVFVQPPLANVGLTEAQAKEKGITVKTATLPASAIPKAKILEQTDGLLKAVIDAESGKVIGAQLLCAEAHEIINFLDLAIRCELHWQDIRDHIFTHPTMSEALNDLFAQFA